jgi:hypothetical protein
VPSWQPRSHGVPRRYSTRPVPGVATSALRYRGGRA